MRPLDNTDIGVTRDRRDYFQKGLCMYFQKDLFSTRLIPGYLAKTLKVEDHGMTALKDWK